MTHQTEAELLPCPFCGSRARRAKEGAWHGTGCAGAHGCPAYLSALTYRTQEEADEAWNRRAPAAPVPQAQKPLTNEECDRLISALCPDFTDERFPTDRPVMRQLARDAIAHGIGATNGQ